MRADIEETDRLIICRKNYPIAVSDTGSETLFERTSEPVSFKLSVKWVHDDTLHRPFYTTGKVGVSSDKRNQSFVKTTSRYYFSH